MDNNAEIIEILKNSMVEGYTSYRLYIYPDIPDEMIGNMLKGLKLPLFYDDILALFDISIWGKCKRGLVFIKNGFYTSRTLDSAYYVNYKDIVKCEIDKDSLNIVLIGGEAINICYSEEQAKYLQTVLCSLASKSIIWNLPENEKKSGPVKDVKDLLSRRELNKCRFTIHSAATACGGVGLTPHIPLSDSVILIPIQVGMILRLGQIFDVEISKAAAQSIVFSALTSAVGRSISQLLVGWIPGIGNAVNLVTAASLTEAIGWNFVREYAQDKKFASRTKAYECVNYFQDIIGKLSDDSFKRFANDISFFSSEDIRDEREKAIDEFFNVIGQYSFVYRVKITKVVFEYSKYLKNILGNMESGIVSDSQAYRYYKKFQKIDFDNEKIDFDDFTDFVELFLGLYNSIISNSEDNSVSKFSFSIELENPDKFFYLLYKNDKNERQDTILKLRKDGKIDSDAKEKRKRKINDKKLLKKNTILILTSLAYCYAVTREGEKNE